MHGFLAALYHVFQCNGSMCMPCQLISVVAIILIIFKCQNFLYFTGKWGSGGYKKIQRQ